MKKILLLSLVILNLSLISYAKNYSEYCSAVDYKKTFSGIMASTTGFNFLSKNIIEHEITKSLKKELNGKFDVDIDNFYGTNILNGEFKHLKAISKQANINGFYLSDINAETICDYNYVQYKDNEAKFNENFVLKYTSKITQDDLNKTINSQEYQEMVNKVNKNNAVSSLFKINTPNVEIKDNKINLKYTISPLPKLKSSIIDDLIKPVKIEIISDIKAQDGKIELCNMKFNSKNANIQPSILNNLNPLNYNFDVSKTKKGDFSVENAYIKGNKISLEGYIVILKD